MSKTTSERSRARRGAPLRAGLRRHGVVRPPAVGVQRARQLGPRERRERARGRLLDAAVRVLGEPLRLVESSFERLDTADDFPTDATLSMVTLAVVLAIVSALGAALYPTWRTCNITPASYLRLQ